MTSRCWTWSPPAMRRTTGRKPTRTCSGSWPTTTPRSRRTCRRVPRKSCSAANGSGGPAEHPEPLTDEGQQPGGHPTDSQPWDQRVSVVPSAPRRSVLLGAGLGEYCQRVSGPEVPVPPEITDSLDVERRLEQVSVAGVAADPDDPSVTSTATGRSRLRRPSRNREAPWCRRA